MTTNSSTQQILIYSGLSTVIAIFGTVTNSLSLSFFINKIRSSRTGPRSDTSTTKLFTALNISDVFVCISASIVSIFYLFTFHLSDSTELLQEFEIFSIILKGSVFLTAFITCLLAVVRTIHLMFPLNVINWRAINLSILVYILLVLVLQTFYVQQLVRFGEPAFKEYLKLYDLESESPSTFLIVYKVVFNFEFLMLASLFVAIIVANIMSLLQLRISQSSHRETIKNKRKATVTVAIISVIFCVCNIGLIVVVGIYTYCFSRYESMEIGPLEYMTQYILLPLNSACNPVVYFVRKEEMRLYVTTVWGRFVKCGQVTVYNPGSQLELRTVQTSKHELQSLGDKM